MAKILFHTAACPAAILLALVGCMGDSQGQLGAACSFHSDCGGGHQCLAQVCTGRCAEAADCGDGYVCTSSGLCEAVETEVGDFCARDRDCGPGQTCALETADRDDDGHLSGRCAIELPGLPQGSVCAQASDCRSGLCSLGACTELCVDDGDCGDDAACTSVPQAAQGALYRACLPRQGMATVHYAVTSSRQVLRVPVPSNAWSFYFVSEVADPAQFVGPIRVVGPSGAVLFQHTLEAADGPEQIIRFEASRSASALLVPNAPQVPLERGVYEIEVASHIGNRPGTAIPQVRVDYRLGSPGARLDLNFLFTDLKGHPCARDIGFDDAASASTSNTLQKQFLPALEQILRKAGISLGEQMYVDLGDRKDLALIDRDDLDMLLDLAPEAPAINLFFVRGLRPAGLQAVGGGHPRAPRLAGTPRSGVALSVETLCYRSWNESARIVAHAIGRQLGLFRNVEPEGLEDPIADSDASADNLMFYGEYGGSELSPGQIQVLRRSPILQ